jgi:hypothetical protein
MPDPQHLLVVIDLNGTLLHRPERSRPTHFIERPHARAFLQYCLETFTVVIWSSAKPENVNNMCNSLVTKQFPGKLAAVWGRDRFGLTPGDYDRRVLCYKRLTRLWEDPIVSRSHPLYQFGSRWNQTNTVLIDDSYEKARSEPHNLIQIPEFVGDAGEPGDILPQVHDYINYLSTHSNVSACIRSQAFQVGSPNARPSDSTSMTINGI